MKKLILFLNICLAVCLFSPLCAYAHENQREHDRDLKYALFGNPDYNLGGERKIAFQAIANGAALAIDQFTPNTENQWKRDVYEDLQTELQQLDLGKLPYSFDSIDLNTNVSRDKKNITANTHRKYTHLGWNYKKYPNMDFWKKRKEMLLEVVNRVFFKQNPLLNRIPVISDILYSPNEQCNAFCAVIYYIHILGDHKEGNTPEKIKYIEPLVKYTNLSTPGIIVELIEYLQVLFPSQRSDRLFISMIQELYDLTFKIEENCNTWGSVDSVDKCYINQENATKLLDIIGNYMPRLLLREDFFRRRFR